jgi:excisionase family DNA binding protein
MKLAPNRLDPSELSPEDFLEVERLLGEVFGNQQRPALVNAAGERLELPQPVFDMLVHVLRSIRERRAIVMMPEDESFTSQAAADYLGMSRPFLISLLDKGEIPFHYVGSHRRIVFKDLLDYERKRDAARRAAMSNLSKKVLEAGLDDASYTGE